MYKYFPTDIQKIKELPTVAAGANFILKTRETYEHFMLWYFLCSVTPECIFADNIKEGCHTKMTRDKFANCSRTDQAVANILTLNMFNFNVSQTCYKHCSSGFLKFQGGETTSDFTLKICSAL